MQQERRSLIKRLFGSLVAVTGIGLTSTASASTSSTDEKQAGNIEYDQDIPLFSGHTMLGNMVFIAGKGAHFAGDITSHTDHVLKELEKELILAGSSMDKVLKVNVYLNDIADYKGMNDVFKGRFGPNPPVRTTVAVAKGGVPGDSMVEMDCIAYITK
ncbi:MAG TPA: RidA family protein [Panacibacter sp.]|nr:RidA family protein [Panacibacter sp.]HNP42856.1 RidA family protein [Panacibacter sp.]